MFEILSDGHDNPQGLRPLPPFLRGLVSILRFDAHAHSSDIQPGSGKLRVRYNWVEMLPKSGHLIPKALDALAS